jgi:uncharacterized protein (TIGR03435 family)
MISRPTGGRRLLIVRPAQLAICALFWRPALILKIAGVILGLNCSGAYGQATVPQRPEFEVASVKPHSSSEGSPNVSIARDPGRLTYMNVTVRVLIREAYGLKVYPLSRGPDALSTDRYDVIAKVSLDASKEQRMLMLQALLAERFKLVVHRETKDLPIYTLVAGKDGAKFHAVEDDGTAPEIGSGGGHQIKAHHISIKSLAATLQGYIGYTVVDETGLTGLYDLNLDFNVDESTSSEGPTVFEAVQRQLGLKLEARKGPVEVVVIDRVEKPSAN